MKYLYILMILLFLSACHGGGESPPPVVEEPVVEEPVVEEPVVEEPVVNNPNISQFGGIYSGIVEGIPQKMVISPDLLNGYMLYPLGEIAKIYSMSEVGNVLFADLILYTPNLTYPLSASMQLSFAYETENQFAPGADKIVGLDVVIFPDGMLPMSFTLNIDSAIYEQPSSIAAITGIWSGQDALGETLTLTVDTNGNVVGSDTNGCVFSGTFSPVHTDYNVYAHELIISQCWYFTNTPIAETSGTGVIFENELSFSNFSKIPGVGGNYQLLLH